MAQRIHMHDQVSNKVEDIMSHYRSNPINDLVQLVRYFIKRQHVIY